MFRTQASTNSNSTPYQVISPYSKVSATNSNSNDTSYVQAIHSQTSVFVIQTRIINELLRKIKANAHTNAGVLVRNEVTRIWNQNIELLALAQLKMPAAILTSTYSQLTIATGHALAKVDPIASQFKFITGTVAPHHDLNVESFDNLDDEVIDLPAGTQIYIPIHYHSSNDFLTGKKLAKALNFLLGEKKCNITLYLEHDNDLPENVAKKDQWINRNSDMLSHVGKKYGIQLSAQEYKSILPDSAIADAEAMFLNCVSTNQALEQALKKDVKKTLAPTPVPVSSKMIDTSSEYFRYWVQLLDAVYKDPNTTPEERSKLLYFWHNVCNPPKINKPVHNPFQFFDASQRKAAVQPFNSYQENETMHRSGSVKIKVGS